MNEYVIAFINQDGTYQELTFRGVGESVASAMASGLLAAGFSNVSLTGDAVLSTAQKKFGTASVLLAGAGAVRPTAAESNFIFGTGDFTIEMWIYSTSFPGSGAGKNIYDGRAAGGTNGAYPLLYCTNAGSLRYWVNTADRITGSTLSTGQWYHIALCRSGTSTKLFVDGVQAGSTWTDTTDYLGPGSGTPVCVGNNKGINGGLVGHVDGIRISKGLARYTSDFTPPAAAHPDSPILRLPTAVANTNQYTVRNINAATTIVAPPSGQTIESADYITAATGETKRIISNGTSWLTI